MFEVSEDVCYILLLTVELEVEIRLQRAVLLLFLGRPV